MYNLFSISKLVSLANSVPLLLKSFWAVDDLERCHKFSYEHRNLLKHYGVTQVSSADESWISNENVMVLLVEDERNGNVLAGARLHFFDNENLLPLQKAIGELDNGVGPYLCKLHALGKTVEICGLWNAKIASGLGLAKNFIMRAGIVQSKILGVQNLLAFCAEHTFDICAEKGFSIIENLGDKGKFFYPKQDLIATALIINEFNDYALATNFEKEELKDLYNTPGKVVHFKGPTLTEFQLRHELQG